MKYILFLFRISFLLLVISTSALALNRIEGQVYDPNRVPVADADVELLSDVNALLAHTKTNSSGHFSFYGVSTGRFTIKVSALRLNLLTQTQDVEVVTISRTSSDIEYVDFYLRYDKRAAERQPISSPDALFVQEIPPPAKDFYDKAVSDFESNPDKGFSELQSAVKLFPNYFDALNKLGTEYVNRKEYEKGYPYLIKAVEVNPRSSSSYYSLAYAFWQLNQIPAAVEAAKAAVVLNPQLVDSLLLYGTLLRLNKNYDISEKQLLKAKALSKKPSSEISWQLAILYNRLNRNQDAVTQLEDYLKSNPNDPDKKKIQDLIVKLKNAK